MTQQTKSTQIVRGLCHLLVGAALLNLGNRWVLQPYIFQSGIRSEVSTLCRGLDACHSVEGFLVLSASTGQPERHLVINIRRDAQPRAIATMRKDMLALLKERAEQAPGFLRRTYKPLITPEFRHAR
ncbi:hypothetical protein [Thauera sp. AutoDN2]|jgi:hypothetical protein|uniref:hypothetical protein n=1 Tax=Thauera sp. AutoDN2 TaxID=3416051 RepID=UPI003F4C16DC